MEPAVLPGRGPRATQTCCSGRPVTGVTWGGTCAGAAVPSQALLEAPHEGCRSKRAQARPRAEGRCVAARHPVGPHVAGDRDARELRAASSSVPMMDVYTARRATGREKLAGLKGPVILVANHASHMDTPVILPRCRAGCASAPRSPLRRTTSTRTASSRPPSRSSSTRCRSSAAGAAWARTAAATSTSCSTRAGTCCSTPRARARATAARGACAAARPCWRRRTTCPSSRSA